MATSHPDPGDNRTDDILSKVADEISEDGQVDKLGKRLGFKPAAISRFCQSNRSGPLVTTIGTKQMLRSWSEQKSSSEIPRLLGAALVEAGLVQIAEDCVPGTWTSKENGNSVFYNNWRGWCIIGYLFLGMCP